MSLHRIVTRKGRIDRVPHRERPVVELRLKSNERLLKLDLHDLVSPRDPTTLDWYWTAQIDVALGEPVTTKGELS